MAETIVIVGKGPVRAVNRVLINKGGTVTHMFKIRTNDGYDPVDLSSVDEFKVGFRKEDGTYLVLSTEDETPQVEVSGEGTLGNVSVTLTASQTETLRKGDGQNVELAWELSGSTTVVILDRMLDVRDPGFI